MLLDDGSEVGKGVFEENTGGGNDADDAEFWSEEAGSVY